jgi:hypothetical protein
LALAAAASVANAADVEMAQTSKLTGVALPPKTGRILNAQNIAQFVKPINEMASQSSGKITGSEVLGWGSGTHRSVVEEQLTSALKQKGFTYGLLGETTREETGTLRLFQVSKAQPKTVMLGYWVESNDAVLLVWSRLASTGTSTGTASRAQRSPIAPKSSSNPQRSAPSVGGRSSVGGGQLASNLVGTWGFTTISGTTYWDAQTGAYRGSGSGGSQSYTFIRNGTYKMFNYIKARTYGFETQALTWENGTYAVSGDRITLRPTSGKYQVISTSRNYTRPMTASELQKNVKQRYWSIEKDANSGKSVLLMGENPNSVSRYKRES